MSEFRPRRAHRKSRGGCHQCKNRHVKCDEVRPHCSNCSTTERQCSYATDAPSLAPRPASPISTLPTTRDRLVFGLEHMSLLLDARNHPDRLFMCDEFSRPIILAVLSLAVEREYIMDQLLATSALQRSTWDSSGPTNYRLLSAQLQGRALSTHNISVPDYPTHDMLPRFIFSLLLGYSHLCDMFSSIRGDTSVFFERFRDYLRLVQLGKTMSREHWAVILSSDIRHIYFASGLDPDHPESTTPEAEQDIGTLDSMLTHSDMGQSRIAACREAVRSLKLACTHFRANAQHEQLQTQAVSVFLIYTPVSFVDVLEDMQPEALIILAHYGALLQKCHDFWAVGDAGRRLVRLMSAHLGPPWDHHMALPREILS